MNELLIWQLVDSAFPAGAFAHSAGLETAWRHGWVRDGKSLLAFIRNSMTQLQRGVVVYLLETFDDPQQFRQIEQQCDLFLNNHVANRASRAQGRAFLRAVSQVFPSEAISQLSTKARQHGQPIHFAPVWGLICKELGIDRAQALRIFLFMSIRSIVSAAIRLGIIGPMEAQQIQASFAATFDPSDVPSGRFPVQTAPMQDLLHGTHDRLYSRLFQT